MKRSQPKRDWSRIQTDRDTPCRVCGSVGRTERAHIAGRVYDRKVGATRVVDPDSIVPLCGPTPGGCHGAFDRGDLDLLPHLTTAEQARAVADLGSIETARIKLSPSDYRQVAA